MAKIFERSKLKMFGCCIIFNFNKQKKKKVQLQYIII